MLPQTVQDCLRETGCSIMIGMTPDRFFMDTMKKYDSRKRHEHICTLVTYDRKTDFLVMNGSDGLDKRLVAFVQSTSSYIGKIENTIIALFEAFKELESSSDRFLV